MVATLSGYHPELEALDVKMRACGRPSPPAADWLRFKGGMPAGTKGIAAFQHATTQWKAELVAWEKANPEAAVEYALLDQEYIAAEDRLEGHKWDHKRAQEHYLPERLRRLGVPSECVHGAATPKETKALARAREWYPFPSWCLVLFGGFGTGKTTAAAWCAMEWLRRSKRVQWVRAPQASRLSLFGAEANVFADLCRASDALVLDDLGADFATDAWRQWLEDILDARWGNKRKTLITVNNLSEEAFRARVGARLLDRFRDGDIFDCGRGSMRGQQTKGETP